MADISQELEQIRNARYGDDIRTAIANALEAINKNTSCTDELASLKETLNRLSEAIDKGAAENASEEEVQVLKAYVDNISDTLNEGESGYIPTRSLGVKAITRDGNGEDSFTSSDYVTRNELNTIRGQINAELTLKATQYDFDYIVGNGFQDWTITDYIIRLREDYNTALSEMSTRTESQAAISQGIAKLKKLIAINESITSDTKVTFTSTSTEIELATMDDIDESFNRLDSYFTFEWKGAWESGGVDSHGWKTDNVKQLRSADLLLSRDFTATLNSLYSLKVVRYNVDKTMINAGTWITGSNNITYFDDDVPNTRYIRLLIKKNDDSDLTNPLLPADIFSITMKGTDWTGENDNTAIDAHLVNELRDDIDKIVEVSETQPDSPLNEIWVLPNGDEHQIPTVAEMEAGLDDAVSYVELQNKTETEKATARANIGAPAILSIAPAYSTSSSYDLGDLVSRDGKIYKCISAISSSESWTAGHWSETSVVDHYTGEVSDLKGALSEYFGKHPIQMSEEAKSIYLNGTIADIDNPIDSASGFHYAVVQCEDGDSFLINSVGGNSPRAWGFLDSQKNILSVAAENATVNQEITAPPNAVYLVINDKSGQTSYALSEETIPERVSDLENAVENFEGINDEVKIALLDCIAHIALWSDGKGQDYYDALYNALYSGSQETWDYEWDYKLGSLEENGYVITKSGTASNLMANNGERFTSGSGLSENQVTIAMSPDYTATRAKLRVTFTLDALAINFPGFFVQLPGTRVRIYNGNIYINTSQPNDISNQVIGYSGIYPNVRYDLQIEWDIDSYIKIKLNNNTVYEYVGALTGSPSRFVLYIAYNTVATIHSLKFKEVV